MNKDNMNFIDKALFKFATRKFEVNKDLQHLMNKKGAGMSGGPASFYIQDMTPYSIGDSAKQYIMNGYSKNVLVYSLINMISTVAAKAKFKLMDISDPDEPEEVKDHVLLDLLKHPAPFYGRREFIENTFGFRELTGECFIYKNRFTLLNKGQVAQLIILPPQYVRVLQDKVTGLIAKYIYYDGRKSQEIMPEDIIYMRYWNPEGSIRGVSPLKAGREVLAQSNDAYHTNRKLTVNGGPPGILAIDDGTGIEFDDTQRDKLMQKYKETYAGPDNAGTPIITNGKWSWTATGLKPEDLMLKEGQRMSLRDMCNIYGVSSQLLNDPENKTYNNMQEARKALITNCVIPKLHTWLDALNRNLVPEYEAKDKKQYELVLDKQAWEEIREDEQKQVTTLAAAWWTTINEKRKVMGLEPLTIPEGDDILVPMNFMPISTNTDAQGQLRNAHAAVARQVAPESTVAEPDKPVAPAGAGAA